jgi:hypothetical protein
LKVLRFCGRALCLYCRSVLSKGIGGRGSGGVRVKMLSCLTLLLCSGRTSLGGSLVRRTYHSPTTLHLVALRRAGEGEGESE